MVAFPAAKSQAQLEVFVKAIEDHLTTTEVNLLDKHKKIWMNSVDVIESVNREEDLKYGADRPKYSKGKSRSHSSNALDQNTFPFEEKPVKREKWNIHREDTSNMDDFVYWDTISGQVDDQARPTDRHREVRNSANIVIDTQYNHFFCVITKTCLFLLPQGVFPNHWWCLQSSPECLAYCKHPSDTGNCTVLY